jgi:hypothetical protein
MSAASDRDRGSSGASACWPTLVHLDESCLGPCFPAPPLSTRTDPQLVQIRQSIWRLRRAFERLGGAEARKSLAELFHNAIPNATAMRDDLFVWLDFIESLVQSAERSYKAPNQGARKAALVKGALLYWIRKERVDLPGIPAFFEPFVFEVGLDFVISAIVAIANKQGIWQLDAQAIRATPRRATAFGWLSQLLLRASSWLTNCAWSFVMRQNPVDAHVRAAIDGFDAHSRDVLARTVQGAQRILHWVLDNRQVFSDLVDLVVLAVNETEGFLEMSGPEKRVYARRYILEFLMQEGLVGRSGLMPLLVEQALDFAIDAVVHVIRRRDGFQPARSLEAVG